jgi:hypothetical protein
MVKVIMIIALSVLVLLTASLGFVAHTYAFGPTCQYSSVSYNYPSEVSPNEQFTVSISMPTVCPQTNNYHIVARFDVENTTNRVLASNYTQYGFMPNNGKPFAFNVTNDLTAPSKPGPWQLQFIVYVFMSEDDADGLDYKVTAAKAIQVEQPLPVQTRSSTVTSLAPMTEGIPAIPTTTQSIAETVGATTNSNELLQVIAVVVAAILVITLALLIRRRRPSAGRSSEQPSSNASNGSSQE